MWWFYMMQGNFSAFFSVAFPFFIRIFESYTDKLPFCSLFVDYCLTFCVMFWFLFLKFFRGLSVSRSPFYNICRITELECKTAPKCHRYSFHTSGFLVLLVFQTSTVLSNLFIWFVFSAFKNQDLNQHKYHHSSNMTKSYCFNKVTTSSGPTKRYSSSVKQRFLNSDILQYCNYTPVWSTTKS